MRIIVLKKCKWNNTFVWKVINKTWRLLSKQSSSLYSGSQNDPKDQKKHYIVNCVWTLCLLFSLTVEVWCVMSSFLEVKQWVRNSGWLLYGVQKSQCYRNNQIFRKNTADFLTMTMAPTLLELSVSKFVTKYLTPVVSQPLYSPELSPAAFFLLLKLEGSLMFQVWEN